MKDFEKEYFNQRPQSLCNKCGRCCKVVTTTLSYKELQELKNNGETAAIDFLDIFEPYPSIMAAKSADTEIVENAISKLKMDGRDKDLKNLTFYHCKYLMDNNLCSIYEDRKQLCKNFPSSPWAVVPPGCGFENWLFLKREEEKQKIRKNKEELLELELLKQKIRRPEILLKIHSVEQKIQQNIDTYKKYGSEDW